MLKKITRIAGIIGTLLALFIYIREPSFPTPDKLLIFLTLIFMAFGQGWQLFKRFAPFVALLLVYESFRGLVPYLNAKVDYHLLPTWDRFLFLGELPTTTLQRHWWNGSIQWYDFVFYVPYILHFVLPFALALVVWKIRETEYWRVITAYLVVSFSGFVTFLLFPASPPWLASEKGLIEPVTRISSHVWHALGIHDFPSVYNKISPNPVAAMPSLHAAYATLFALFVTALFKSKWRWLAWIYPVLIWVGTVYQGEHYAIDEIAGIFYALGGYFAAPYVLRYVINTYARIKAWYTAKA